MNQIKFRVWDKKENLMRDVASLIIEPRYTKAQYGYITPIHIDLVIPNKDFELMQYTGLKDKNGKEIYESDYLGVYCVFWDSGKYILQNISTGDILDCNENTTYNREVTGNRYENPREHKAMASDL